MSGERPVPVGNFDSSSAPDRNQYLETGELNERVVGGDRARSIQPVPKTVRGDRDARHSTSAISTVGGGYGSNSFMDSGPQDFDESRSWSRNGYYERDPPPVDYGYGGREYRERDPYYGHPNDYGPRRPGPVPSMDPYYRERERSYAPQHYRHNPSEYYPQEPSYGMYSMQRRGFPSPRQPSKQQIAYLNELRIRDPARYREWYDKFKEHKKHPDRIPEPPVPGFPPHADHHQPHYPAPRYPPQNGDGTRTPIHFRHPSQPGQFDERDRREKVVPPSGRSSRNNGSFYQPDYDDSDLRSDESEFDRGFAPIDSVSTIEEPPPEKLAIKKFTGGHSIGLITPFGQILQVARGSKTVNVFSVKSLLHDLPESRELEFFPGPLVRGKTHKNTVIKFCQKKIKFIQNQDPEFHPDRHNLILLWELLILLIKQNGSVVGSDIAELLLKKKARLEVGGGAESESNNSELEDEGDEADRDSGVSTLIAPPPLPPSPNDAKITQRFCDRLLFGHRNDALEFAMQKGLWGHALFLASKMGDREYGQVMARFANGVAYNHPLQTLYQIMSGRVPSSMTGCMDLAFGDWKPHLAMIISNAGIRPEVEQKAFITLGDTLRSKNEFFGSQFCYLMAQSTFSEESKLGPLLGLCPDRSNVIEATQMTEIYEYAMSLADAHFNLGSSFLNSKFDYVKSLLNFGFTFQAYSYSEVISKQVGNKDDSLRWNLLQIGERLRCVDPSNNSDWIQDLRTALLEPQTTDHSESSSRRGSYPPSSVGVSSMDQGSPATGLSTGPPPENVTENGYDPNNFIPNTNYQAGQSQVAGDGFYDQPEHNTTQDVGAYELNPPPMYEANPIPMLPRSTNDTYNSAPGQFHNPPNTQFETNQESSWGTQPMQSHQPEVPSWETSAPSPYFNPNPDRGQQESGYFQQEQKPYDFSASSSGINNNIYPPGTFIPSPGGMTNGYPGMDVQQQPHFQSTPSAKPPMTQSSNHDLSGSNPKRKTVRFEDDEEGQNGRMSRSQALNILRRVESDEVTETSEEEDAPRLPVQFKSTYPIDTVLGHRIHPLSPNAPPLRTSKVNSVRTYPVDRKCCDVAQPCADHNLSFPPMRSAGPNLNSSKESLLDGQWKAEEKKQGGKEKDDGKKASKAKANASNTNKGGLLGWLGLRGKNQMILPDDKEPAIVWDEKTKQWVNTKSDDDDTPKAPMAPPKDSDLMPRNAPAQQQPPMGYGGMPPSQHPQPNYGHAPSTVPDGAMPSFKPQLNQPVTSMNHHPSSQPLGPSSLNYNHNAPGIQPASLGGPNSLNVQQPNLQQPPPSASNMNKYKLPKSGAGMRGKYVDVFGGTTGGPPSQPMGMNPPMMAPMIGNTPTPMFIPSSSGDSEEFQEQR